MSVANLSHCRAVLLRVTAGLGVGDLDYRPFPDSKSNGEILLHIAGFEYLMIASALSAQGKRIDAAPWTTLKGGFAREAGFPPPVGRTLDDYIACLGVTRQTTTAFLGRDRHAGRMDAGGFAIAQVASDLSAADRDADQECYRRLAPAVTSSLNDDGAVDGEGMVDIATVLVLHESYHRGQVTLNKYIRSRMLRASSGQSGS